MRRLLIIGCSDRKIHSHRKIRAWDLYDGVAFRVLKKLQRENLLSLSTNILIISAKYGLIRPNQRIGWYDLRMNAVLAGSQSNKITRQLKRQLKRNAYAEVCVNLGVDYLPALGESARWLPKGTKLTFIEGPIGKRLRKLRQWAQEVG